MLAWNDRVDRFGDGVVDGLKLTIQGGELRRLLDDRIAEHERSAADWRRALVRAADDPTGEETERSEGICASEALRHEWRIDVLTFIRDHVEPLKTYRIGGRDLALAELLPVKPWCVEREELEARRGV